MLASSTALHAASDAGDSAACRTPVTLLPCDACDHAGPAGGEMPHVQACMIYVLRVGAIEQLSETGQRKLLDKLAALGARTAAPPVSIAALEAIGVLLETLGEVPEDTAKPLESMLMGKLIASSGVVRSQGAAVLAALVLAAPSMACRLLGFYLENLETQSQLLASLAPRWGLTQGLGAADTACMLAAVCIV
jgi:hypothetical protein